MPEITQEALDLFEQTAVRLHNEGLIDLHALRARWDENLVRKHHRQNISKQARWRIYRRDIFTCQYCFSKEGTLSIDHVVPSVKGGSYDESNLVTCCTKCNNLKGEDSLRKFLDRPWILQKQKQNLQLFSPMMRTHHLKERQALLLYRSENIGISNSQSVSEQERSLGQ